MEPMKNVRAERKDTQKLIDKKIALEKEEISDLSNSYKSVFSTVDGLKVYRDIMKMCHYNKDIFSLSNSERNNIYNQGKNSIALQINKNLEK